MENIWYANALYTSINQSPEKSILQNKPPRQLWFRTNSSSATLIVCMLHVLYSNHCTRSISYIFSSFQRIKNPHCSDIRPYALQIWYSQYYYNLFSSIFGFSGCCHRRHFGLFADIVPIYALEGCYYPISQVVCLCVCKFQSVNSNAT